MFMSITFIFKLHRQVSKLPLMVAYHTLELGGATVLIIHNYIIKKKVNEYNEY